jgi:hypothetical protein
MPSKVQGNNRKANKMTSFDKFLVILATLSAFALVAGGEWIRTAF